MTNWSNLPNEIKFLIIGHLNYSTRKSLKQCFKLDKEIVEKVPLYFHHFHFSQSSERSVLLLLLDDKVNSEIVFQKSGTDTIITRNSGTKTRVLQESNIEKLAVEYLKKHLKNVKFGSGLLELKTNYNPLEILSKSFSTEKLYITSENSDIGLEWISKFKPIMEKLEINIPGPAGVCDLPHVQKSSKRLIIRNDCVMNDEQLLTLKASEYLEIISTKITDQGLNRFFKKCLSSNSKLKFQIKKDQNIHRDTMFEGLDIEIKNICEKKTKGKLSRFLQNNIKYIVINRQIAIRIRNENTIIGDCEAGGSEAQMLNIGKFSWHEDHSARRH